MKNAIPEIIIGLIVIGFGVYVATHQKPSLKIVDVPKNTEQTKKVREPLSITSENKKEIKAVREYDYTIPVVTGAPNLQIAIDGQIERLDREFVAMAEEEGTNAQSGYSMTHAYEVIRNDADYLTIIVRSSLFLGGAHGNPSFRIFTYNRATESLMTQKDVLMLYAGKSIEDTVYVAVMKKYASTDSLLRDVDEIKNGIKATIDSGEWIGLGKKGIYVRFPVYTLAPYVAGELSVEI